MIQGSRFNGLVARTKGQKMLLYDPTITWSRHTVQLEYMFWDYRTLVSIDVSGDRLGFDVMTMAIELHAKKIKGSQGNDPKLLLKRREKDGNGEETIEARPEYRDDIERWLQGMCVGVKLLSHVKQNR